MMWEAMKMTVDVFVMIVVARWVSDGDIVVVVVVVVIIIIIIVTVIIIA